MVFRASQPDYRDSDPGAFLMSTATGNGTMLVSSKMMIFHSAVLTKQLIPTIMELQKS